MIRPSPPTLLLDFLAARTGGQLTRARAFLGRLRDHDPDTRLQVLHANGALDYLANRSDLTLHEAHFRPPGIALRRLAWQNLHMGERLRATGAGAYLTFSHDLPLRFPSHIPAIVGVSNLAPFSPAARRSVGSIRSVSEVSLAVTSPPLSTFTIAVAPADRRTAADPSHLAGRLLLTVGGVEQAAGGQ